jgi:hypothetical protein
MRGHQKVLLSLCDDEGFEMIIVDTLILNDLKVCGSDTAVKRIGCEKLKHRQDSHHLYQ